MMSEGHSYGTDNLRHNFQTTKRERPNAIILLPANASEFIYSSYIEINDGIMPCNGN